MRKTQPAIHTTRHMRHATGALFGVLASLTLATMPIGTAAAEPPALTAADPSRVTPKLLKKCKKCHYETGVSDDPEIPHLAGQPASYLYKQLQDFKADQRDGGRMNKTARKLSDQQIGDLVAYYAARSLPEEGGVSASAAPGLVTDGDVGREIDACADCHGSDGRGKRDKYDAPALAGMPLDYFKYSMERLPRGRTC